MLRSRVFWRLYLGYVLLVVIAAGVIGLLLLPRMRGALEAGVRERLAAQAAALTPLAAAAFRGEAPPGLQASVATIARETGVRITFVAGDGSLLLDSGRAADAPVGSLAPGPEIVTAPDEADVADGRFRDAAGRELLYFDRRVDADGRPLGVLRVAIPVADLEAEIAAVRREILTGGLLGILATLVPGVFLARRFSAPIADMTRVSQALRRGRYDARVRRVGSDELGVLGENLNRLADELRERIDRVSKQGAQLDAILRGMQEGVVALGPDGSIAFSNRAARGLLGLGSEADGQALRAAIDSTVPLAALLRRVGESETPGRCEVTLGEGEAERVLDVRATPFAGGSDSGVLLVLYNVTELRRLERVRTDFVANVSHELKTPLTSIQGYVETLLDGAVHDPDHNVRFLQRIEQHVRRLSALVSDLLSLARIEAPARTAPAPVVDWREVIAESVARRRDPTGRKRLDLALELGAEPIRVRADPEDLRQILDNLLDNAINYTPAGGSIRVLLARDDGHALLQVADTGIGIPREALGRIFERFYRVDRGRSRELGGTGLGLSIVRNLVLRLGGTVSVDSRVSVGSTFRVRLPLAPRGQPGAPEA